MPYKILVVDDEPVITELLYDHLSDNGYLVYTAQNANSAMEQLKYTPDLILLDINMPGTDGLELCRMIRQTISCPILFLTARITEQDKINGLRCGGDDYITKPFSLGEITARIEAHLRREERIRSSAEVVSSSGLLVKLSARRVQDQGEEITFPKNEIEILEYLLTHAGQTFDRERIYEAVWGYDAEGDSDVVKEHIRRIRTGLKEATGKEYIETVWGMGYKWRK